MRRAFRKCDYIASGKALETGGNSLMLGRGFMLGLAGNKKLETFIRSNPFASKAASRFVAGEKMEDLIAPVRALNSQGISVSLDLLGESVKNEKEVRQVVETHLDLFKMIQANELKANVSLKLSSLGLDIDPEQCYRNVARLLLAAPILDISEPLNSPMFVRIDMEGSDSTQRTLDLFYRLRSEKLYNTGVVIQAYLRRSEEDIERLIGDGVRVRLCKGAYKEPEQVAFPQKSDVDASYVKLMKRLMLRGNYPGIATHDERIIREAKEYAKTEKIAKDRFEFQMLYGIRRDLQTSLIQEGYLVRCYTPFGDHWYPYFMRRLAERPANAIFILKNLLKP